MQAEETIGRFLAAVRARLYRREAAYWGAAGAAALAGLLLLAPLAAALFGPDQVNVVRAVAGAGALAAAGVAVTLGIVRPRRRFVRDPAVARVVGQAHPALRSDLLSAVELTENRPSYGASPALVGALTESTAAALRGVTPESCVPLVRLRRPFLAAGVAGLAYAAVAAATPGTLATGFRTLFAAGPEGPLERAEVAEEPLVGDIRITLDYPEYTERETTHLENAGGSFRAMPGSTIRLETRVDEAADRALLVLEGAGAASAAASAGGEAATTAGPSDGESKTQAAGRAGGGVHTIEMAVSGRDLEAEFEVIEEVEYRFFIRRARESRLESRSRAIEIEADRPPDVELTAPERELEVSDMKRVELAYTAEDDYGLTELALVWQDEGDAAPQREDLPLEEEGPRRAEGAFLWDLADVPLEPGGRVEYWLEARDSDDVLGPNTATSEVYYLRVYSPREEHERATANLRELFEDFLHHLADRLEAPEGEPRDHEPIQRAAETLVADLGALVASMEEGEIASPSAREELGAIEGRLRAIADAERELLRELDRRPGPSEALRARADESISILEDDVLLLADRVERMQLENMLALGDEIESRRERLDELLEEYARTESADLLEEIERELENLERKLADLAESQRGVPSDVADEFVHEEALVGDEEQSCVEEVRERVRAGEVENARAELEACARRFEGAQEALEDSLGDLRSERFSEEERAFGEVMNELADLARDQDDAALEAEEIWDAYAERAAEEMEDQAEAMREEAGDALERLREAIAAIPEDDLSPFSEQELEAARRRVADIDERLEEGDIAGALAMAREAEAGLEAMAAELEAAASRGDPRRDAAAEAAAEAVPPAEELVEMLSEATPEPWEMLTPEERNQLDELRERQEALRDRAESLAEETEGMQDDLPGDAGEAIAEGLGEAGEPMGRAVRRMLERDPSGARQETREAAERLAEAEGDGRAEARERERRGGGRIEEEPVRIPEAGEHEAPEQFREELLEAMKSDDPPEEYEDLVRRYYEELIR